MQFRTHPVSKRTRPLTGWIFSRPQPSPPARAVAPTAMGTRPCLSDRVRGRGGRPDDVTKSLWRNILLIHVRLYNLAHFYSGRGAAARRARLDIAQYRYSIFIPYFPNSTRAPVSSFLKKKQEKEKRKKKKKPILFTYIFILFNKYLVLYLTRRWTCFRNHLDVISISIYTRYFNRENRIRC